MISFIYILYAFEYVKHVGAHERGTVFSHKHNIWSLLHDDARDGMMPREQVGYDGAKLVVRDGDDFGVGNVHCFSRARDKKKTTTLTCSLRRVRISTFGQASS